MDLLGIGSGYLYQLIKSNTNIINNIVNWLTINILSIPILKQFFQL